MSKPGIIAILILYYVYAETYLAHGSLDLPVARHTQCATSILLFPKVL